ncbi:MAG: tRNA uracil 4-sulfurtransferase ThiI [Bacillota bacterium]|jgi:thiamine biosynthesis protein ThiI
MGKLLLVRYGELGLKGKNKSKFINRLANNIRKALSDLPKRQIRATWGRIWIETMDDEYLVIPRLQQVFGIYSISPVVETGKSLDEIAKAALEVLKTALPAGGSFKVETKRADKTYPMLSIEISQHIAGRLFDQIDERYVADMHHPDRVIDIEVRQEGAYVYGQVIPGAKGLPVGSSGKALLLLSGGIDSPVAGWMAMKRGVTLEAIHFHSFPFTGQQSKEKVLDLCKILAHWQGAPIKLHIVHFTEIQKAIREHTSEDYTITLLRRMMFRLAEKIAHKGNALALLTGESIGQVASQTLESIQTINDVINIPVLRPLIGMDKEEIVKISQQIEAFPISIRPYEDCCTIFLPAYPKIRPRIDEAEKLEEKLAIPALLNEALEKTETLVIE